LAEKEKEIGADVVEPEVDESYTTPLFSSRKRRWSKELLRRGEREVRSKDE